MANSARRVFRRVVCRNSSNARFPCGSTNFQKQNASKISICVICVAVHGVAPVRQALNKCTCHVTPVDLLETRLDKRRGPGDILALRLITLLCLLCSFHSHSLLFSFRFFPKYLSELDHLGPR
jgi:hypothetical protein